ncbi:isochorismatase family protein [Orrella marina]|nr:isochorismatase family protein [Orrella marina]
MEMLHRADQSAVILVDLQARLMPSIHEGERIVTQAVRLARIARVLGVPVVATEQNPQGLGHSDPRIQAECDRVMSKSHFNACEEGLTEMLPATSRHAIVAGCEAHVCVLQTCMGLLERDFRVTLVIDAIGSRADLSRLAAIERLGMLQHEGLVLASVEMVAFEWLRTCRHPKFREALALIK